MFDQIVVRLFHKIDILLGDIGQFIRRPKLIAVRINDRPLINDVDLAFELIFLAERKQNRPGVRAQLLAHAIDRHLKVGTDAIHFVNERDARDIVFHRLPPNRFRLRLHAGHSVEHCNRAIKNAQRPLHFRREIDVTRRINDVDALLDALENFINASFLALRPRAGRRRRRYGDAALALLFHPVRHGRAFVHFADLVDHAGVKQNAFGQRRFACIDVRGDPDVPRPLEREFAIGRVWIFRRGLFLFHCRRRHNLYQRKCANARFACAILCVSSRFLIALP